MKKLMADQKKSPIISSKLSHNHEQRLVSKLYFQNDTCQFLDLKSHFEAGRLYSHMWKRTFNSCFLWSILQRYYFHESDMMKS